MIVPALGALLSANALGFHRHLQSEAVEEAYSLGQTSNHEEFVEFINQYQHNFKYPSGNPVAYVQSMEFQTPYEQIVLRSKEVGAKYDKFQAMDDYQSHPGRVQVRVVVSLRLNHAGPVPDSDSFRVTVSQSKPVEPLKMSKTVLCDPYTTTTYQYSVNRDCSTYLLELLQQFDSSQFSPGRAAVTVTPPDSQPLETTYDLDKLK